MNERIKQLAVQAGLTQAKDFKSGDEVKNFVFGNGLEKFAELIVLECAGIVDKIVPPGYEDYPDYRDQIEQSFRRECATEIKKHFGVEE
jgi:hypothetical protein